MSELLPCPWDGRTPKLMVIKIGCRDEPSTYVKYECPHCGIAKGASVDSEGEKLAHAFMYGHYGYAKPGKRLDWWDATKIAMESTVAARWNTRF